MTLGINQLATVEALQKAVIYLEDMKGLPYLEWQYGESVSATSVAIKWITELSAHDYAMRIYSTNTYPYIDGQRRQIDGIFFGVSDFIDETTPEGEHVYEQAHVMEGFAYVKYGANDYRLKRMRADLYNGDPYVAFKVLDGEEVQSDFKVVRWDDTVADVENAILAKDYKAICMNLEGMKVAVGTGGNVSGTYTPATTEYTLAGMLDYNYKNESRDNVEFIGTAIGYTANLADTRLFKVKVAPMGGVFKAWSQWAGTAPLTMRDSVGERKPMGITYNAISDVWRFNDGYGGAIAPEDVLHACDGVNGFSKAELYIDGYDHMLTYMGETVTDHHGTKESCAVFTDGYYYLYAWQGGEIELKTLDVKPINHYYIRTFEYPNNFLCGGLVTKDNYSATWTGSTTSLNNLLIKDTATYQQFWDDVLGGTCIVDYRMDIRTGTGASSIQSRFCRLDVVKAEIEGAGQYNDICVLKGMGHIMPTNDADLEIAEGEPEELEILIKSFKYVSEGVEHTDYPSFCKGYNLSLDADIVLDTYVVENPEEEKIKYRLEIMTDEFGDVMTLKVFDIDTETQVPTDFIYDIMSNYKKDVLVKATNRLQDGYGGYTFRNWFESTSMVAKHVDLTHWKESDNDTEVREIFNTWQLFTNWSKPYKIDQGATDATITNLKEETMYLEPSLMTITVALGVDGTGTKNILTKMNKSPALPQYSTLKTKALTDYSGWTVVIHTERPFTQYIENEEQERWYRARMLKVPIVQIDARYDSNDFYHVLKYSEAIRAIRGGAKVKVCNSSNLEFGYRDDDSFGVARYWDYIDIDLGGISFVTELVYGGTGYDYDTGRITFTNGSYIYGTDDIVPLLYFFPKDSTYDFDFAAPWRFSGTGDEFVFDAKNQEETIGHPMRLSKDIAQFNQPTSASINGYNPRSIWTTKQTWKLKTPELFVTDTATGTSRSLGSVVLTQTKGHYEDSFDEESNIGSGYAVFTGVASTEANTRMGQTTTFEEYAISVIVKFDYRTLDYYLQDFDFIQRHGVGHTTESDSEYCKLIRAEIQGEIKRI